jgi:nucleoside-diphosphate-sugar epimerase
MILITGASGFIGQHTYRQLAKTALKEPVRLFLLESELDKIDNTSGFEILTGNLSDKKAVAKASAGVDTIIHLASKHIDFDGTGFQKVNIDGTANLCEAAVSAGCKKFIYLSSVGVYGHHKYQNADEETSIDPDTPFSRSKAEAERMVLEHHKTGKFQGIILRHRFVYGEGDAHVLPRIIKATTKYPFLLNWGKAKVSLIFVEELAELLTRFATGKIPRENNPIYHATDGVPIRYRDLVKTICNTYSIKYPKMGIPYLLLYIPVRLYEKIFSIDPETTHSSLSSIRLKLVGLDNYFSNKKITKLFPDLVFTPFKKVFSRVAGYYKQFMPIQENKEQKDE